MLGVECADNVLFGTKVRPNLSAASCTSEHNLVCDVAVKQLSGLVLAKACDRDKGKCST